MRKTALEMIEEMSQFYIEDPSRRCVDENGNCYYYLDGKFCAAAFFMENKEGFQKNINQFDSINSFVKYKYKRDSSDPEFIKKFWSDIQAFHDGLKHWNENGITQSGILYLQELKEHYKDKPL